MKSHQSQSWKEKSIFSLRLLIEYINAHTKCFDQPVTLLQSFTDCLTTGTFDYEVCYDPSGLYWRPRSIPDANSILAHITHYTDALALQKGYDENQFNPFRDATKIEEHLNWCAYYQKQKHVFLNHLSNQNKAHYYNSKQRSVSQLKTPTISDEKIYRFPEEHFNDLLYKGFIRAYSSASAPDRERLDYKNIAITLLLNGGGDS